jgi:hypothetical protein
MTALFKGGAIHSILEHYPKPSPHKLAPKYQYIADIFTNSKLGKTYLLKDSIREFKFGLSKDLKPTGYNDKEALFRGSIDFICVEDGLDEIIEVDSLDDVQPEYEVIEIL